MVVGTVLASRSGMPLLRLLADRPFAWPADQETRSAAWREDIADFCVRLAVTHAEATALVRESRAQSDRLRRAGMLGRMPVHNVHASEV